MKKLLMLFSFNERYILASFFYFGVGLMLLAITPQQHFAVAQSGCGGESVCPTGYKCVSGECRLCPTGGCPAGKECCGGDCITSGEICCSDGSHGECGCCGNSAITTEPGFPCPTQ